MKATQIVRIVIDETCDYFKQDKTKVLSRCRKREYVTPKHFAMYFAKKYCKHNSLKSIGAMVGKYDHATVLHAIQHIKDLVDVNGYKTAHDELNARIRNRLSDKKLLKETSRARRHRNHYKAMNRKSRQLFRIFQYEHSMGNI